MIAKNAKIAKNGGSRSRAEKSPMTGHIGSIGHVRWHKRVGIGIEGTSTVKANTGSRAAEIGPEGTL